MQAFPVDSFAIKGADPHVSPVLLRRQSSLLPVRLMYGFATGGIRCRPVFKYTACESLDVDHSFVSLQT